MEQKSQRLGIAVILCALVFRLYAAGVFAKVVEFLTQPDTASFLIYLETGRRVRSPSSEDYFFQFLPESAQPVLAPTEVTAPVFSQEDERYVSVYDACAACPDVGALLEMPLDLDLTGAEPTVLILHTHATESYTKAGEDYQESAAYRTLDENYNMLSIGDKVAQVLTCHGVSVLHDCTLHDYPSYNGSYTHARSAIASYLEEYPTIQLVLDLHRDASDSGSGQLRTVCQVSGQTSAQIMLVMGTNHDHWQENLSLGLKLQAVLEQQAPGITRATIVRSQRFNQDLSPGALLVEVGAAGNTHDEALLAAQLLAEGILTLAGIPY